MDLRIFLSSTHDDLEDARQKILRLLSVLPADLVHMETFGSDETKPIDYCLQQVRKSNLFIGVYAERYGTVDPASGRSISELEYREAAAMLKRGGLLALLVYILDSAANWRVEFVDREQGRVEALAALKDELKKNHTAVFFKDPEELSLQVLKDILRKVGVGTGAVFRPRRAPAESCTQREGPLGMEHYTERDAAIFRGREDAIADVVRVVESSSIALLIGDSGIGKTSLIQAGVFPILRSRGWVVASSRPLDNPDRSIPGMLWSQLMEGLLPAAGLANVLELVADAHRGRSVLVVIDQLEDVISGIGTGEVSNLLAALTRIHGSPPGNLHLLLSYRGDAEPKVGRYWQTISGSASGLPRYYLQPLSIAGAMSALEETLSSVLSEITVAKSSELLEEIVAELNLESMRSVGVAIYPPFLQMIAETVFKKAQDSATSADVALYRSLGSAREIIGRYLGSRLHILGPRVKESRAVLVSLAAPTSRLRKSSAEISTDTGLARGAVETCLADLSSLRLVHAVGASWEITHDFLAQKVIEDLVAPEEREARVFRDVLIAKAAAFRSTGEILSVKEHLGVYAHRSQITPARDEAELLFVSHLAGNEPVRYFLRNIEPSLPIAWAHQYLTSTEEKIKQNAHRYLIRSGVKFMLGVLAEVFSDHKLQSELAQYINQYATNDDVQLLLRLRRKKAELTREAAYKQLEMLIDPSDAGTLQKLIRSAKPSDVRLLCRLLIAQARARRVSEYRARLRERALVNRIAAACGLAEVGTRRDVNQLFQTLSKRGAPLAEREVISYAIAYWAQARKDRALLRRLLNGPKRVCRGVISALEGDRAGLDVGDLLEKYSQIPFEVAEAVRRTAKSRDVPRLRRFVSGTSLEPSSRDLLIALLEVGDGKTVRWVAELAASKDYQVYFWNVPALARSMSKAATSSIKPWLKSLTEADEFWKYTGAERGKRPLPVQFSENLYLFKRLVGITLATLCNRKDWTLLRRLVFHDYWLIQIAAAERIAQFAGIQELNDLVEEARRMAKDEADPGVVYALTLIDEKLYGSN
jgi:hypothetical protein